MTPKDKIDRLREEINRHNHNYYVLNAPQISDKDFDMLLKELEALEKEYPEFADPDSPTQRVGSDLTKGFEHVVHARPMMSLSNTYSIGEVDDWFNRMDKALEGEDFSIVGEMKFDGTSISLTYRHGRLVRAVTRGDGTQGDDVTANVRNRPGSQTRCGGSGGSCGSPCLPPGGGTGRGLFCWSAGARSWELPSSCVPAPPERCPVQNICSSRSPFPKIKRGACFHRVCAAITGPSLCVFN